MSNSNSGSDSEYHIPNDSSINATDIEPNASLSGADLSEADLSHAELRGADLSQAYLHDVDLHAADLRGVDLSRAGLSEASLSRVDLRGADLIEANLRRADLTEARLYSADLEEADMREIDLSRANLTRSDLMETDLRGAVLSEAQFIVADLEEAHLRNADLRGANLRGATLVEANLVKTNLSGALLWETSLSDALLSRQTTLDPPGQRLQEVAGDNDTESLSESVDLYDAVARVNYELRAAYSQNGLVKQARNARVRERCARRREAKADETLQGTLEWGASVMSQATTGYGVQLVPVVGVMVVLLLGSAGVYADSGLGIQQSLYYSLVTFTTSPPSPPKPGLMQWVAGAETFLGTTAIVFLGYVLGTRDRV